MLGLLVLKLVAGDGPGWEIGLPVPVAMAAPDATVLTQWGNARLEVEAFSGTLQLSLSMLPWWLLLALAEIFRRGAVREAEQSLIV